jgi:hypothetical protein
MQHAEASQTTRVQLVLELCRHSVAGWRSSHPRQRHETVSIGHVMRHNGVAFLEGLLRLFADDRFTFAILPVVVVAAVLAFGFWAQAEIVASVLIVGVMTVIAETKLRARN